MPSFSLAVFSYVLIGLHVFFQGGNIIGALLLLFNLAVQTGKTGCICIDLLLKADSLYGKDCNQAAQDYGN